MFSHNWTTSYFVLPSYIKKF